MNLLSEYYGNALALPIVCSKAETLCKNSIGYVVQLVKKAKDKMSEEYRRSSMDDLMLIKGRRIMYQNKGNFIISDLSKVGFDKIDWGWGKPIFFIFTLFNYASYWYFKWV